MSRSLFTASLLALSLAACATHRAEPVAAIDGVVSGQCHTDMVRGAVGVSAAARTLERARVDSDSNAIRVVDAGTDIGTAESGGDRLTVQRGRYNSIAKIACS